MTEPAPHLDLDGLADHLAGEVDATAHLSSCGGCTARLAELEAADRAVAAVLRELADPRLPDDVADRIAAALAAEAPLQVAAPAPVAAPPTVVPLASRQRARPRRAWLPSVAAGVVLVAGGLIGAQLVSGGGSSDETAAGVAAPGRAQDAAPPAFPTVASGLDYAIPGAIARALPAVLDGTAGVVSGQLPEVVDAPLPGGSAAPQPSPAPPDAAVAADPLARLRDPAALADCLAALLDPAAPDERPLALDYATYSGAPALAVLLPDPDPTKVSVFVVGPDCSRADDDLQFFTRVARP